MTGDAKKSSQERQDGKELPVAYLPIFQEKTNLLSFLRSTVKIDSSPYSFASLESACLVPFVF
jgi:hypothetical protein